MFVSWGVNLNYCLGLKITPFATWYWYSSHSFSKCLSKCSSPPIHQTPRFFVLVPALNSKEEGMVIAIPVLILIARKQIPPLINRVHVIKFPGIAKVNGHLWRLRFPLLHWFISSEIYCECFIIVCEFAPRSCICSTFFLDVRFPKLLFGISSTSWFLLGKSTHLVPREALPRHAANLLIWQAM